MWNLERGCLGWEGEDTQRVKERWWRQRGENWTRTLQLLAEWNC